MLRGGISPFPACAAANEGAHYSPFKGHAGQHGRTFEHRPRAACAAAAAARRQVVDRLPQASELAICTGEHCSKETIEKTDKIVR